MQTKHLVLACALLAATLSKSQNVGIGTTTPVARLEINGLTSGANAGLGLAVTNYGNTNDVWLRRAQGTVSSPTVTNSSTIVGRIWGLGYDGANFQSVGTIHFVTDGTTTSTGAPGSIVFSTQSASTVATPTEKFRVTSTGALAIGGASNYGTSGQVLTSNGNGAPAWSGMNQGFATVYGTSALTVTNTASATLIPGLTQTVTVPANCVVYVSSDGGVLANSTSSTGFSITDITLEIDGTPVTAGGYRRVTCANNSANLAAAGATSEWSFSQTRTLSAGSHTIAVYAQGTNTTGATSANVSGSSSGALQGQLTVGFIKQ